MRRRLIGILLAICMLTNLAVGLTVFSDDAVVTGTVHADLLYVRQTPGGTVVGELYDNDIVTILGEAKAANGDIWYHVSKGGITGYAHSDYITINKTVEYVYNKAFEDHLTAQNFPESYKVELRKIFAQYPNWIFEARHLDMTWDTALAAESKVGLNTITSPDAWKSMEYGAFNWTTSQYVQYDSGGWVAASPRLIAYYMDPRNFLDSTYIFQFEKLTFSAAHTVEGVRSILPDALDKHAEAVLQAAKDSNTSAYHLAARMRQEGSHTNGLGTGTVKGYEGYYNFFHFGAYQTTDKDGNVISAVTNGAIYAKNKGWNDPYKCIKDSADNLARGYIRLGQDTVYFQKFNMTNTTSGLYSHQYMSNTQAAASEGRIRRSSATAEDLDSALVFSIPVYKNMPDAIAPLPSTAGTNNNFLNNIIIPGEELTPTFDRYRFSYSMHMESAADITIEVKVSNRYAVVASVGTVEKKEHNNNGILSTSFFIKPPLQAGTNVVPITVTSTSGEKRTYTLSITCDKASTPPVETEPEITGTTYKVGETITKVEPNTAVDTFIQKLAVKNGTAKLYTAAGQAKTSGLVATGDIVRLYSGTTEKNSYPVVIYGDVNGDGKVTSYDLRVAQKHILTSAPIQGYYLTAADSSKDGRLTSYDLRVTQKYILKITTSIQ